MNSMDASSIPILYHIPWISRRAWKKERKSYIESVLKVSACWKTMSVGLLVDCLNSIKFTIFLLFFCFVVCCVIFFLVACISHTPVSIAQWQLIFHWVSVGVNKSIALNIVSISAMHNFQKSSNKGTVLVGLSLPSQYCAVLTVYFFYIYV